jgi:hypothetical protein
MKFADWLLLEVALLLIGLTKISLTGSGFDHPSVKESTLMLRARQEPSLAFIQNSGEWLKTFPNIIVLLMGCK